MGVQLWQKRSPGVRPLATSGRALASSVILVVALVASASALTEANPKAQLVHLAVANPPSPSPKGDPQLVLTYCPVAGSCVAVGSYVDSSGYGHVLIETLSGGAWIATEAPLPAGAAPSRGDFNAFNSLTCPVAGTCVAVGAYYDSSGFRQGLIETLSGGIWSAAEAPLPASAVSSPATVLYSVTCPGAGTCVAVGSYDDSGGNTQALTETLSGGTWSPAEAPLPPGTASNPIAAFFSVTCPVAGMCVAVGSYVSSSGTQGLIDTLSGGAWSAAEAPLPAGAATNPVGFVVSAVCPVAGTCVAVGSYTNSSGAQGLIETLSGGTWSATEAPLPPGAASNPMAEFSSMTCPVPGTCVAVGRYYDSSFDAQGLIETLSAGSWSAAEGPLPAGAASNDNTLLYSVACPVAGTCVAVGTYGNSCCNGQGVIESLSGGTWTAIEAPLPPDTEAPPEAGVNSVACPVAGSCVAVGTYVDLAGNPQGLIDTLSGGSWTGIKAPLPSGALPTPLTLANVVGGGFLTVNIQGTTYYIPPTTCTGCPINTATGEFFHTFDDLSVPGRGMALDFTRTYSSAEAKADQGGRFGPGWADSYEWSLSVDASGNATVASGTGSSVTFTPNGSGGFNPPSFLRATLTQNADGTYTFTGNDRHSLGFDSAGQLVKETDANGYTTTLSYSGSQLASVTDPGGRALTFSYGADGDLASVTDPAGRTVSFAYDSAGNLSTATDAAGGVWHFTYDSNHLMLSMTNPGGGVTTNSYDSAGEVTSETDPQGRTTSYTYATGPGGAETTTETDPVGNVTQWNYSNLELTSVTKAAGTPLAATTTHTYDPTNLGVTSTTDADGHTSTMTYDSAGNLLTSTDALGRTTAFTYNSRNEVLTVTDPKGVTTTNDYDQQGNLISTSTPIGSSTATTAFAYGDGSHPGDVTAITDPNGHVTNYGYDTYGDRTAVTDAAGDRTTYTFNMVGQMTSSTSADANASGGSATQYAYDSLGHLVSNTDPLGHQTTYTYDASQNLVSVKGPDGNVSQKTFDADNEATATNLIDSGGHVQETQTTTYDNVGNILTQTDGSGATTYTYDALNRMETRTDPLGHVTAYGYDLVGNLTSVKLPSGQITTYSYDADNEQTGISYSDGKTPNVVFKYDADGQRTSMTDGSGTTSYTFDALHRLTKDTQGDGSAVSYGYDLAGNPTTLTYPSGQVVTRTFDSTDRLASVTDWLGNKTSFGYDPDSNLISQTFANGVSTAVSYDAADQLTSTDTQHGGKDLLNLAYTRDPQGLVAAENTRTFGYDGASRLTSDSLNSTSYVYSQANELTGVATQAGSSSLSYDRANELTSLSVSQLSTVFSYDAEGNRISASGVTSAAYGFDQANRMTSLSAGKTVAGYVYNGDGLRMSKIVNKTSESFVWDVNGAVPLILEDASTSYVTGPGGLPLEQIDSHKNVRYYHHDQVGSTRMITDSKGKVVASYSYDAYGNQTASHGSISQPFGFAGQLVDSESGLIYLRGRYYDPATVQFTSADPLSGLTRQPYAYAHDDPQNRVDWNGLDDGQSFCSLWDQIFNGCTAAASPSTSASQVPAGTEQCNGDPSESSTICFTSDGSNWNPVQQDQTLGVSSVDLSPENLYKAVARANAFGCNAAWLVGQGEIAGVCSKILDVAGALILAANPNVVCQLQKESPYAAEEYWLGVTMDFAGFPPGVSVPYSILTAP